MATVLRANRVTSELGGHIASFASSATLYDVGFNHFWHAPSEDHGGDLVFIQGHTAPGIYARAFLEGRLSEADLSRFRQETAPGGLSSYPHPWLMPDFWEYPTVSMGLGPIMSIYQARFNRYLEDRGVPSVFVSTVEFVDAANVQAKALGTSASAVYVEHPIQDRTDEEMQAIADKAVEEIVSKIVAH